MQTWRRWAVLSTSSRGVRPRGATSAIEKVTGQVAQQAPHVRQGCIVPRAYLVLWVLSAPVNAPNGDHRMIGAPCAINASSSALYT